MDRNDLGQIIGKQVSFMKQTFECISFSDDHYKMKFTLQPGGSIPAHRHQYMDELFEISEGETMFTIDGQQSVRSAGDCLLVTSGTLHALRNISASAMHCTVTYTPCADTHRMFAIYTDLYERGYREAKLMMKAEYLSMAAGLQTFSASAGVLRTVEQVIQAILKPIGRLKGWDKEAAAYRR